MNQILLLLPDGFELLEAAAFTDVFGWNMVAGDHNTQLITAGAQNIVKSSFGHCVTAERCFAEINYNDFSALALPGGFARYGYYAAADNADFIRLLQNFAATGKPIAAVCTGAILLGRAGLLHQRRATTYQGEGGRWLDQLAESGAIISRQLLCQDGAIITSSGPATAVPVALRLLAAVAGEPVAAAIADIMEYPIKPSS